MIHRIPLHRPHQHHHLAIQPKKTIRIRRRLARQRRHHVRADNRRPVDYFLVILAINRCAYIGRGVEHSGWVGVQDGIGAKVVVGMVVGDEDGDELVVGGNFGDPLHDGLGVGYEEGRVDEDGVGGAGDEGCDAGEALFTGLVDMGFELRHDLQVFVGLMRNDSLEYTVVGSTRFSGFELQQSFSYFVSETAFS